MGEEVRLRRKNADAVGGEIHTVHVLRVLRSDAREQTKLRFPQLLRERRRPLPPSPLPFHYHYRRHHHHYHRRCSLSSSSSLPPLPPSVRRPPVTTVSSHRSPVSRSLFVSHVVSSARSAFRPQCSIRR